MTFWSKNKPAEPAPRSPVKVLVIDDDEAFRELISEALPPHGFDVMTAGSPVKALEFYTHKKDEIQLILLDYYMPHLDGPKTLEWLRKLNPQVKVIVCSGADALHLRQMQAQQVVDGCLHKPFRIQEALELINRVLAAPARP